MQYDDVTVPLALTDCDVLNNKSPPQSVEGMKVAAGVRLKRMQLVYKHPYRRAV